MKIKMFEVEVSQKLSHAKSQCEGTSIKLPCLVNTKAVSRGDELLYFIVNTKDEDNTKGGTKRPFDQI